MIFIFYFLFPDAFLCISMIFYSLSYMFIQIYYSCFFTHINNIFKYVVFCSICLQFFLSSGVYFLRLFYFSESPLPAFYLL